MSVLAWFSIIISVAGVVAIAIGAFLAFNDRNNPTSGRTAFIVTLAGIITYFIGWLLFLFFLFFSKGIDLNRLARSQLKGTIPTPDVVVNDIVDGSDQKFREWVGA